MPTLVANHSSYPKIGERPEEQKLRRAIEKWEKQEISDQTLREVTAEVIQEVITEQEKAGVDLVTDGQIRWQDPISHWVKGLKGVRLRGLLRFFDTNCYFRVPHIDKPLELKETPFHSDLRLPSEASKKLVKVVLMGPVTIAALSERGAGFGTVEELVHDLSSLLAEEISLLSSLGASWIQIDEPIVIKKPELFPLLLESLKLLVQKKGRVRILLASYFADAAPFYEKLQDLPVDGLVLDCVYGSSLLERVAREGSQKLLCLGVVDGRSTRIESAKEGSDLVKKLQRVRLSLGERELQLTSSCGLEYLPRARAFEKLRLLKQLKEMVE